MSLANQSAIKSRILKYAMELWGVKNAQDMDPVIDLLLDVFAYESYKLHDEIDRSDSMLLHRLSGILVDSKWSLPFPSHALMTVCPNNGENIILDAEDHFYAEKYIFGKDEVQVFFTPLFSDDLKDVRVVAQITSDSISYCVNEKDFSSNHVDLSSEIETDSVWLALEIGEDVSELIDELKICAIPHKWDALSFQKAATFHDIEGNVLRSYNGIKAKDPFGNAHYFDDIKDFYNDLYFDIYFNECSLKKAVSAKQLFNIDKEWPDCEFNIEKPYRWIRMVFSKVLDLAYINEIRVLTNTFPVVNRRMVSQQHNFKTNGSIIPLYEEKGCCFLNIRCLQDDFGSVYIDRMNNSKGSPTGVFSLYFGDLERFDSSNARSLILKLIQSIKEEGNAFAAMKPDTLTSQLKSLFEKINSIEKEMASHKDDTNFVKAFVLTIPNPDVTYGEIKYWSTAGEMANGFPVGTMLHQFNMDKFDGSSIYMRTVSQGGRLHINDLDLIRSLRYGLLSKERIVSKEDIRSYIMHKIGSQVDYIDIQQGVAISDNPNKGLVRITDVKIRLKNSAEGLKVNFAPLSNIFEKELSRNSVIGSNYKVCFV